MMGSNPNKQRKPIMPTRPNSKTYRKRSKSCAFREREEAKRLRARVAQAESYQRQCYRKPNFHDHEMAVAHKRLAALEANLGAAS
jgi:hypothetical protein